MEIEDSPATTTDIAEFRENLKIYYNGYFPFDIVYQWLNFNGKDGPYTEVAFVLLGENGENIYNRSLSFNNANDFKNAVQEKNPVKIELGATYNVKPGYKDQSNETSELIKSTIKFDIDTDRYADVITCCRADLKQMCNKCWKYIVVGAKVLEATLREDFGLENNLFVYSGGRGAHCWVKTNDEEVFSADSYLRNSIIKYLSIEHKLVNGFYQIARLPKILHPKIKRAFEILEPYFEQIVVEEQQIFDRKLQQVLELVSSLQLRKQIKLAIEELYPITGKKRWKIIKSFLEENDLNPPSDSEPNLLPKFVLTFLGLRLDDQVTKETHLLKSIYSPHPTKGTISIPIDILDINKFKPSQAPTLKCFANLTVYRNLKTVEGQNRSEDIEKYQMFTQSLEYFKTHLTRIIQSVGVVGIKANKIIRKNDISW